MQVKRNVRGDSPATLTLRQVALALNVSNDVVRQWSERGLLKSHRMGARGYRKFLREDVERFFVDVLLRDLRMFTVQEVATSLRVHPGTVRHWSDVGLLKTYRLGRRGDRRFRWKDVDEFMGSMTMLGAEARWRGRVLIVDDDSRIRDLLRDVVREQGHEAIAVGSGERALEEMEARDFGLVFLDLMLPGLSGVDVLREMRAKGRKAVVAVVTGHGDPLSAEAMSLGPCFFVKKPFDIAHVIDIIHSTIGAPRPS